MKETLISDLYKDTDSYIDKEVTNSGRDVTEAINNPPTRADPNFVCLLRISP